VHGGGGARRCRAPPAAPNQSLGCHHDDFLPVPGHKDLRRPIFPLVAKHFPKRRENATHSRENADFKWVELRTYTMYI